MLPARPLPRTTHVGSPRVGLLGVPRHRNAAASAPAAVHEPASPSHALPAQPGHAEASAPAPVGATSAPASPLMQHIESEAQAQQRKAARQRQQQQQKEERRRAAAARAMQTADHAGASTSSPDQTPSTASTNRGRAAGPPSHASSQRGASIRRQKPLHSVGPPPIVGVSGASEAGKSAAHLAATVRTRPFAKFMFEGNRGILTGLRTLAIAQDMLRAHESALSFAPLGYEDTDVSITEFMRAQAQEAAARRPPPPGVSGGNRSSDVASSTSTSTSSSTSPSSSTASTSTGEGGVSGFMRRRFTLLTWSRTHHWKEIHVQRERMGVTQPGSPRSQASVTGRMPVFDFTLDVRRSWKFKAAISEDMAYSIADLLYGHLILEPRQREQQQLLMQQQQQLQQEQQQLQLQHQQQQQLQQEQQQRDQHQRDQQEQEKEAGDKPHDQQGSHQVQGVGQEQQQQQQQQEQPQGQQGVGVGEEEEQQRQEMRRQRRAGNLRRSYPDPRASSSSASPSSSTPTSESSDGSDGTAASATSSWSGPIVLSADTAQSATVFMAVVVLQQRLQRENLGRQVVCTLYNNAKAPPIRLDGRPGFVFKVLTRPEVCAAIPEVVRRQWREGQPWGPLGKGASGKGAGKGQRAQEGTSEGRSGGLEGVEVRRQ